MSDQDGVALKRADVVVLGVVFVTLVSVMLPGCLGESEASRRATCLNNQWQLTLALLQYESTKVRLPGYVNRITKPEQGDPVVASWVVPLLPYLERNDLWKKWRAGERQSVFLEMLVCPSDPPKGATPTSAPLGYVANCGRPGDADTPAHGVFHNHDVDANPVYVSLGYVARHDGATATLLLSENIQAGFWTDTGEADLGMVWRDVPQRCSFINRCRDAGDRPQDIRYARPSSNHGGGVVASFCDGHTQWLREDIDYDVYQHLMTPNGNKAGVSGVLDPASY